MSTSMNVHGVDPSSIILAVRRYDRFATLDIRFTADDGARFQFDLFLGNSFDYESVEVIVEETLKNLRKQLRNIDNIVDERDPVNA